MLQWTWENRCPVNIRCLSFDINPRSSGPPWDSIFICLRKLHTIFLNGYTNLHFCQQCANTALPTCQHTLDPRSVFEFLYIDIPFLPDSPCTFSSNAAMWYFHSSLSMTCFLLALWHFMPICLPPRYLCLPLGFILFIRILIYS